MKNVIKKLNAHLSTIVFLLTGIAGFRNIILALPTRFGLLENVDNYINRYDPETVAFHGVLSYITGLFMIMLANKLRKKVRNAWLITIVMVSVSMTMHISRSGMIFQPIVVLELIILGILIATSSNYTRKVDKTTLKKGVIAGSLIIILFLVNMTSGIYILKDQYTGVERIEEASIRATRLVFLNDLDSISYKTNHGRIYATTMVLAGWASIFASVFFILRPVVMQSLSSEYEHNEARRIVMKNGRNPLSYLALENDKTLFFGSKVEGLIAYTIVSDIAVICGDIICEHKDAPALLREFIRFCDDNYLSIVMLDITSEYLDLYQLAGFGSMKYGEDAVFDLQSYSLKGNKVAKVRAAINRAAKDGIVVEEYKPNEGRNLEIEKGIEFVSNSWFKSKRGTQLKFMLGTIGLEKPMDRRYFVARDANGMIQGFVVFIPFSSGKGYLAEVTRKLNTNAQGVMETIIYEAFMKMKSEGVRWGSLGLSPLANVKEEEGMFAKAFDYIYENLNAIYGFKTLHHSKEKFSPTRWENRYMSFYPNNLNIMMAYSIVKAQNPDGIYNMIKSKIIRK